MISCRIATATPELVDELLSMNIKNRTMRRSAVDRLVADIKAGAWVLTASGIGVDSNNVLSDGQHRLEAIRQAGYPPVQFMLARGLSPKAQSVVDRHAKRSLADALSLVNGRTISNLVVAACNALILVKGATQRSVTFSASHGSPSDSAVARKLIEWEDELLAVQSATNGSARAAVCAALAVYYRHKPDAALEFCDQIKRGLGLSETDPAYRLRAALKFSTAGGAAASVRSFATTASAICAHSKGAQVKMIRAYESWDKAPWATWLGDSGATA